jgi:hypothetical protein
VQTLKQQSIAVAVSVCQLLAVIAASHVAPHWMRNVRFTAGDLHEANVINDCFCHSWYAIALTV